MYLLHTSTLFYFIYLLDTMQSNSYSNAGMFTTALRWVAGWTYFSAFWRRLILENKLDPEAAGYIGEKFNHFLPHALGIQPMIEHLVSNPDQLWWSMLAFTIIEGVVGLFFMLGLFTRLMSIGIFSLAFGILLGSGWIGTTCLDEWQIGILGVASGFTIFLTGGGRYTLDAWMSNNGWAMSKKKWFPFLASGDLPIQQKLLQRIVLLGTVFIFGLTLFTNQQFHGGVYGTLHNLSVRPHVIISETQINNNELSFKITRDEGADVYGSFLIGIQLIDDNGQTVFYQNQQDLSNMTAEQIENDYVAKIKPSAHSLILPLGAKAKLLFHDDIFTELKGNYTLELLDISGASWTAEIEI